jgi:serine/threonine protein kinase
VPQAFRQRRLQLSYDRIAPMHATPVGFTFLSGTERATGSATRVFGVAQDGRGYVCKRLGPRALGEPWMRERLTAEGRLLALLEGRGAPQLVASGEDAAGPWLIMQEIAWPALSARTTRPDGRWLEGATGVAFDALALVHAAGVVHGDISPDNVLVSNEATAAVLVDFGLALGPSMPPMPSGPFRGTLVYAAPEVARGEPFDARADLFSIAASLLHVWSGESPRPLVREAATLRAAGEEGIEAWAERSARGLEPGLARRLMRCCAFDAKERLP